MPAADGFSVQGLMTFANMAGKGVFVWDQDLRLIGRNAHLAEILQLPLDRFPVGSPYSAIKGMLRQRAEQQGNPGFWPLKPVQSFAEARGLVASDGEHIGRIGPEGSAEIRVQRMIVDDRFMLTILTDMSVLNPLHREITRQHRYLQTMLQNMTDGAMLVDEGYRIIACNRRLFELCGIDESKFELGMSARDFVRLHSDFTLVEGGEARERAIDAWTALITCRGDEGETVRFDRRLLDGTCMEITRTGLPRGAAVLTVRDGTETAELARQRHLFRTVIENINEGVTLIGADGVVQVFNQRLIELYDIDKDQVAEGMHAEKFVRNARYLSELPSEIAEREILAGIAFATGAVEGKLTKERALSSGRTLHLARTPLEDGSAVTTYRDITQERERTRLLAEAKAAAEDASMLKSDFLARVTHELRTPMNGVLGMAALLERTDLDDKQRQFLQVLVRSGQHMVELIDGLLTVGTQESGGLTLSPEPLCLHDLCGQCVEMVRPRAAERGLTLKLLANADVPPKVMADRTRLTQIIVNLLQNAVKFTETGQIELHLRTQRDDGFVTARVDVIDTGIGIDEEKLDDIFLKFSQVDESGMRKSDGVGLGLSIAKSLSEMMGGTLSARSRLGEGSAFTLDVAFPEAPTRIEDLSA